MHYHSVLPCPLTELLRIRSIDITRSHRKVCVLQRNHTCTGTYTCSEVLNRHSILPTPASDSLIYNSIEYVESSLYGEMGRMPDSETVFWGFETYMIQFVFCIIFFCI